MVNDIMVTGWTKNLVFAVTVSGLASSWQLGYNLGALNACEKAMKKWIRDTRCKESGEDCSGKSIEFATFVIWLFIVNINLVGGLIGGLMSGFLTQKSSKMTIFIHSLLF